MIDTVIEWLEELWGVHMSTGGTGSYNNAQYFYNAATGITVCAVIGVLCLFFLFFSLLGRRRK